MVEAESLDSSNGLASALAKRGAPHGTIVLAGSQTKGRGRWNRRWDSGPGGLYISIVLRPDQSPDSAPPRASLGLLPLGVAVAVVDALDRATGIRARLHWPNDLYVKSKKIAGILCESTFIGAAVETVVAGIGVNVNQSPGDFSPEVRARATSVRTLVGREMPIEDLAVELLSSVETWWDAAESSVLARFEELMVNPEGGRILVTSREGESYVAETRGLAPDGGLRVSLEDGTMRTLRSDDVHLFERPTDRDMEDNYYAEVESHFVERRGSPLFISPGEWHLVSRWEELGIPLEVVKEGIDRVFARPKTDRRPRKLGYCRQTVESAFRRFREARLGNRAGASSAEAEAGENVNDWSACLEDIRSRLGELQTSAAIASEGFTRALAHVSALIDESLREGIATGQLAEVEDTLAAADQRLVAEAEAAVAGELRDELRRQAAASLEPYRERMPEKVYHAALESAYRRRLRRELGLPTLSLYAR